MNPNRELPIITPDDPKPTHPDEPQKELPPYNPNRPLIIVPDEPAPGEEPEY